MAGYPVHPPTSPWHGRRLLRRANIQPSTITGHSVHNAESLPLQPSRVRLCDECRSTILVARRVCSTVIEASGALPRGRLGHCNAGTDRASEPSKLL